LASRTAGAGASCEERHKPHYAANARAAKPPLNLSDEVVIAKIRESKKYELFRDLFNRGDWEGRGYKSQSEGVMALLRTMAFFTGPDPERMDRLFRASALFSGKWEHKWDDLRGNITLGVIQIRKILEDPTQEYYPYKSGLDREFAEGDEGAQGKTYAVKVWPAPLADAAYYGVLGDIAKGVEPYIEADSAALLVNLLTASGIAMGRNPYLQVGALRHYPVLNAVTVGDTGDNKSDGTSPMRAILGRAGLASSPTQIMLEQIQPRILSGLSTGEGLLWQIRDERYAKVRDKKTHAVSEELVDEGVADKRLLVMEPEFARVLAVMYRDGNTLSTILRDLFDSPAKAEVNPKNNPISATEPHVGVIGQVTPDELRRKLHETELFNGFAGRFLWALTRRIKSLPIPLDYEHKVDEHARWWGEAILKARRIQAVRRNHQAEEQWTYEYERLRRGEREGIPERKAMALDVASRAHVMVLRMSLIFAALDGNPVVTTAHQDAALAVWDYCERCVSYLFGEVATDPVENVIAEALRTRGALGRRELLGLFSRHLPSAALQVALDALLRMGKVRCTEVQTAGRPVERWELA
jgi:hypothetical protein